MGNPLFKQLYGDQPAPTQHSQQPVDMRQAMTELQAHPAQLIRQAGFTVPDEIAGNPQAAAMHIIQSGQVKSPILQRLQPMLNMLLGRR
ncbi:MAG: hypothetical protein IK099_06875 [Clostridia bacterium]|nr:hypothetical protein [Clostridia bacterium]